MLGENKKMWQFITCILVKWKLRFKSKSLKSQTPRIKKKKRTRKGRKCKVFKSNDNLTFTKLFIERGKLFSWHHRKKEKIQRNLPKLFFNFFDSLVAQQGRENF